MDDDWDLHAVVRGCAAITTTSSSSFPATNTTSGGVQLFSTGFQQDFRFPAADDCFQDLLFEPPPRRKSLLAAGQELHELYKPFIFKSSDSSRIIFSPRNSPIINSPPSVFGGFRDPSSEQQQQLPQKQQPFCFDNGSRNNFSHNPSPRSKKRKIHMKRVCHLAAENLSSDVWCWRKYGQKPIKGSPYPRSYYRCSTSKGCLARKQVEQNRSEPGMFIVTYTAEHNHPTPTHRNSLAGSTRQKHVETRAPNSDDLGRVLCSPETSSSASPSAAPEKLEGSRENLAGAEDDDDDNDDGFSVSKMEPEDDFFAGLEDFNAPDTRGRTSVDFPANLEFSWLSCSATTIAGGG